MVLPKSATAGCISRTVGLLACTSGPDSMRSPRQVIKLLPWDGELLRFPQPKESPATRWLAHRPDFLAKVLFWFADILARVKTKGTRTSRKISRKKFQVNVSQ